MHMHLTSQQGLYWPLTEVYPVDAHRGYGRNIELLYSGHVQLFPNGHIELFEGILQYHMVGTLCYSVVGTLSTFPCVSDQSLTLLEQYSPITGCSPGNTNTTCNQNITLRTIFLAFDGKMYKETCRKKMQFLKLHFEPGYLTHNGQRSISF